MHSVVLHMESQDITINQDVTTEWNLAKFIIDVKARVFTDQKVHVKILFIIEGSTQYCLDMGVL